MEFYYQWLIVFAASALRYLLFAVLAYMLFYVWKKNKFSSYKIQLKFPKAKAIEAELRYSLSTIFIFSVVIIATIWMGRHGYTKMYFHFHQHSILYFLLSIMITIILHDIYFYWTHRLMHWKKIFPYVHRIHHLSHNPTPLAAFSFHPVEALIEIGILPIVVFILPLHPFALSIFGFYMIILNVMGHLGFELFPKRFITGKMTRWHNTSTHHNMHHHYSKYNFSLYFNFWDKLMGTNHPAYRDEFEKVVDRRMQTGKSLVEKTDNLTENNTLSIKL